MDGFAMVKIDVPQVAGHTLARVLHQETVGLSPGGDERSHWVDGGHGYQANRQSCVQR